MVEQLNHSVSVIIPTRNRAAILAKCLEAVAKQTSSASEIIVVDDDSSDGTAGIVQDFANKGSIPVQLIRQVEPRGANAARNTGLDAARGSVIAFLDDDAIAHPGWLKETLQGLSGSGCPVVTGAVRLNLEGPLIGKHREEVSGYLAEVLAPARGLHGEVVPVAGNMAAFRWVFDRARFDEIVRPPNEEVDWLQRAKVCAAYLPDAWVWHYKTPEELRLGPVLRLAWRRGSEGGWWLRERAGLSGKQRILTAFRSLATCGRSLGHATIARCWGGMVIAAGEFAKSMALLGLMNRSRRKPQSWR